MMVERIRALMFIHASIDSLVKRPRSNKLLGVIVFEIDIGFRVGLPFESIRRVEVFIEALNWCVVRKLMRTVCANGFTSRKKYVKSSHGSRT